MDLLDQTDSDDGGSDDGGSRSSPSISLPTQQNTQPDPAPVQSSPSSGASSGAAAKSPSAHALPSSESESPSAESAASASASSASASSATAAEPTRQALSSEAGGRTSAAGWACPACTLENDEQSPLWICCGGAAAGSKGASSKSNTAGGLWMVHNYVKQLRFEGNTSGLAEVALPLITSTCMVLAIAGDDSEANPGTLVADANGTYHIERCSSPEYHCYPPFEDRACKVRRYVTCSGRYHTS